MEGSAVSETNKLNAWRLQIDQELVALVDVMVIGGHHKKDPGFYSDIQALINTKGAYLVSRLRQVLNDYDEVFSSMGQELEIRLKTLQYRTEHYLAQKKPRRA